nr:claudin f [Misgurnus anguillicaudatus]
MVSAGLQMLGTALAIIGWICVIVACALPMWRVTAFIGQNIVTAQTNWEGIWMSCVVQSTGQMQCKVYDSMLALSSDLQAARAMCIVSILVGLVGIMLAGVGGKCTNCIEDESAKAKVGLVSGVVFIISGLLCLIPVCWTANTIIRDFYNPLVASAQKGICLCCGLPMWRVTTFIGANIVSGQIVWDGLWMNCVMQSTGQMQCKIQDSIMKQTQDLQAARALTVIAILISFVGMLLTFVGGQCSSCLKRESSMAKVLILGGILCIIAGVVCLIPVCWSCAYTISDYESVLTIQTQKRELGASIYIGWGAAGLLLFGGIILCTSCPPRENMYPNYPPMYPYQGPMYGPPGTYMPPKTYAPSVAYTGTGTYVPNKPLYSAVPGQYLSQADEEKMVSMCRQIMGLSLGLIGFLGAIIICALPMWRVTAFIGANIVTAQVIWEGLWMNCVMQSTGQMQCKIYDSLLALPQDLQAARALVVIAIIVSLFGVFLAIAGGKCTNFVEEEAAKAKVAIASGVIFIVAGVLVLVPVCWSANSIIRDFYNPMLTDAQRREMGPSLYIGWGVAALMILGGGILCSSCPPKEENYGVKYSQPRSVATSKAYV